MPQWICSSNAPSSVASRFSMASADEAAAVVEICRRLDGIPLAIELAASRMASMTASEVRDRLDHRFRLLVGSRRGLERHQTLRHAVAWSYDLLDDAEKTLLERCSVFAGGFDLQSACAVAGSDASTTTPSWICSTRWCASRCWSPTGHRGGPGFRCWRRSASSPRNNSSPAARQPRSRTAHARYFAGREADILALWDSPRQREAYDWFTTELANLRTAFRWAADHGDLDAAATIATYRGVPRLSGRELRADRLGRRAHRARPRRRPSAARVRCTGRVAVLHVRDASMRLSDTATLGKQPSSVTRAASAIRRRVLARRCVQLVGDPEQYVAYFRSYLSRAHDHLKLGKSCLVVALTNAGHTQEAISLAAGLDDAVETAHNPYAHSFAMLAYGMAWSEEDPLRAIDVLRRGRGIAKRRQSGQRDFSGVDTCRDPRPGGGRTNWRTDRTRQHHTRDPALP